VKGTPTMDEAASGGVPFTGTLGGGDGPVGVYVRAYEVCPYD
jgi:hypothetical protein